MKNLNLATLSPRSSSQPHIRFVPCDRRAPTHKYTTNAKILNTLSPQRRKAAPRTKVAYFSPAHEFVKPETVAVAASYFSPKSGLNDDSPGRLPEIVASPRGDDTLSAGRKTVQGKQWKRLKARQKPANGNYFDWFTRMYAELQYGIMTMNRKRTFKSSDKAIALEEEMKKICDKGASTPGNSIDKAKLLISKFNRIKTRGNYYITTDEFADCEVHLINESDSEAEQVESQLSEKIKLFIDRHGPKALTHALSREQLALVPHISYHIGPARNQFVPYLSSDCNVTQPATLRYSRDKKSAEKVFGTEPRMEYKQGKDAVSLHQIRRFGFWEVQLLSGEQPKNLLGKAFGSSESIFFYTVEGSNESVAIYTLKLSTCRWNKFNFKVPLDIPSNFGEVTAYSNGRIVSHGGTLAPCRHKQEAEIELRILDLRMGTKMLVHRTYASPADRIFHSGCIVEDKFWIYGGVLLNQTSKFLSDVWTYDLDQGAWAKIDFEAGNEHKGFRPHPLAYHSMTPVFSKRVLPPDNAPSTKLKSFTGSRFEKLNHLNMGIYVFGGEKENKRATNELFYIRPIEKKPLSAVKFSTCSEKETEISVECFKPNVAGRPPIPRGRHSAAFIADKYLVIYGGYNTSLSGSRIVNDVVLLNLHSFQWEPLAVCGYQPEERYWCTPVSGQSKVYILGGNPEKAGNDRAMHCLELDQVKVDAILQSKRIALESIAAH